MLLLVVGHSELVQLQRQGQKNIGVTSLFSRTTCHLIVPGQPKDIPLWQHSGPVAVPRTGSNIRFRIQFQDNIPQSCPNSRSWGDYLASGPLVQRVFRSRAPEFARQWHYDTIPKSRHSGLFPALEARLTRTSLFACATGAKLSP